MRVFIAGMFSSNTDLHSRLFLEVMNPQEQADRLSLTNLLESYHYVEDEVYVKRIRADGTPVFMDSGAFSAFTLGKVIDLDAYCRYLHENADIVEVASVLDGIGDPLKTYQNQVLMERAGTKPLPCFHYGEDERYLEHYIANYEFITLGGMVPNTSMENQRWLDRMWSKYLCKPDGSAKIRVHGFGMTSTRLMKRYPWYSVDSSSWVQIGFRGGIFLPDLGNIFVSAQSPTRKLDGGRHFNTLSPPMQQAVRDRVEARGYTIERLATIYISRWIFNAKTFALMGDAIKDGGGVRFQLAQDSLF